MTDEYLIFDIARVVIAACALWLGILILKLCYQRWRNPEPNRQDVHPLTYFSFALALFAIVGYRIANLGQPPSVRLFVSGVIVLLGMIGVLKRVNLGKPFHREH